LAKSTGRVGVHFRIRGRHFKRQRNLRGTINFRAFPANENTSWIAVNQGNQKKRYYSFVTLGKENVNS